MASLNADQLDWQEKQLDQPTLNEVAQGVKKFSSTWRVSALTASVIWVLHNMISIFVFVFISTIWQLEMQHFHPDWLIILPKCWLKWSIVPIWQRHHSIWPQRGWEVRRQLSMSAVRHTYCHWSIVQKSTMSSNWHGAYYQRQRQFIYAVPVLDHIH